MSLSKFKEHLNIVNKLNIMVEDVVPRIIFIAESCAHTDISMPNWDIQAK